MKVLAMLAMLATARAPCSGRECRSIAAEQGARFAPDGARRGTCVVDRRTRNATVRAGCSGTAPDDQWIVSCFDCRS